MNISRFTSLTTLCLILVNLAGEYMDVVLALTIEWYDKRLVWGLYDYTKEYAIPIKTIEVSSNHIWTPRNAIFHVPTFPLSVINERSI